MTRRRKLKVKPSNKAVAYIRTSSADGVASVGVQEEKIRAYAAVYGLEISAVIKDIGVPRSTPLAERPAGAILYEYISNGYAHIITSSVDRLFGMTLEAATVSEEWNERGVSLHILDVAGANVDTGSAMGRFFMLMLAACAQFEDGRRLDDASEENKWLTKMAELEDGAMVSVGGMVTDIEEGKPWAHMRIHGPCMIFDWYETEEASRAAVRHHWETVAYFPDKDKTSRILEAHA